MRFWLASAMVAGGAWTFSARGDYALSTIVGFTGANGSHPRGGLVLGTDGYFYGTTVDGGANGLGTIYRMSPGGDFTTLYSFEGGTNGANPSAALIQGADGDFYGTAYSGGGSNVGTVFRFSTNGVLTTLASLSGTNGAHPDVALVQAADGSLLGCASDGGPDTRANPDGGHGFGSIFRVTTNGTLTALVLFNCVNGATPCGLIHGSDGNYYGTTVWGGRTYVSSQFLGFGTVFQLTNGVRNKLYGFTGDNDGGFVRAGLAEGADGAFYGATAFGGVNKVGTVFRITPQGAFSNLVAFTGNNGSFPYAALTWGGDGYWYGTTYQGGYYTCGTVFRLSSAGAFSSLAYFPGGEQSSYPRSALVRGPDGNFYGTTVGGGPSGYGTVFRFSALQPPTVRGLAPFPGGVRISCATVPYQAYKLQYVTHLGDTNWRDVGSPVLATNSTATVWDPDPGDPQRFYRAVLLPPKQ